ncbi:LacI family transcriptional regulator [Paenibacillus antibioticophila]|uniref:LacI family transcriptional regulator n=1 Tax=Paenibacillus antibioticophila TaxID=1274374 RepID=A0A919XR45_9BACL|nr:LacI family DNA-binding transcriptional regulator [Paenibacillus antibioticophila]GIO37697.1 LacI family transcriptional regulator [Paenibacillus antibioticophila]
MLIIASILDIARLAGVSKTTVSKVLNHQYGVHEETRKKVWQAAAELHYTPNIAARALVTSKTGVIGVVYDSFKSPIYNELAGQLESQAQKLGIHLVFCSCNQQQASKLHYIQYFMGGAADGVILFGSAEDDDPVIERLMAVKFPFVVIEHRYDQLQVPNVLVDNVGGAKQAVQYLYKLGHRHIAHVTGNLRHQVAVDRYNGFKEAMQTLGLEPASDDFIHTDGSIGCGQLAAQALLERKERPTALFVFNDLIAYEMIDELHRAGLRIPEDMSVIGFDHLVGLLSFKPGIHNLTSISQPLEKMAHAAMDMIMSVVSGQMPEPISQQFKPVLQEGGTCQKRELHS